MKEFWPNPGKILALTAATVAALLWGARTAPPEGAQALWRPVGPGGDAVTGAVVGAVDGDISDVEWEALKKKALARRRKVIYNNDGGDVLLPMSGGTDPVKEFIADRMDLTLGSKIDTVSYVPVCSGFNFLSTNTKVGDIFDRDHPSIPKSRNVLRELIALGTDTLNEVGRFCRANDMEFWVGLRGNDTHDMSHRPDDPHFLFPPFKEKNPQFLMGTYERRPPYCQWSAVDFTHPEIREKFVAMVREFFTNYEVDGIELDFCRHVQYFKSVALGAEASEAELEMMNECMREIRRMAETIGRQRRRPILIAVRTPDSAAYARAVGLDLEKWMQEKLIDIHLASFYLRLNPWRTSAELCRKYGVQFIPSLDESRIETSTQAFNRQGWETYHARIAAALHEGGEGIYFFNIIDRNVQRFRGDMEDIRFEPKRYFITYRYMSPKTYVSTGDRYDNWKNLSPMTKLTLLPGQEAAFRMEFGDDLSRADVRERNPRLAAHVQSFDTALDAVALLVNGREYRATETVNDVLVYPLPLDALRPGLNDIVFKSPLPDSRGEMKPQTILKGDALLAGSPQTPWRRLFAYRNFETAEAIVDGAYRLVDDGVGDIEQANLFYPIMSLPAKFLRAAFELKVEAASEPLACAFRVADGKNIEIVTFEPNAVGLHFAGKKVPFNTADAFHDYDITMKDGRFTLAADGRELLNEPLVMKVGEDAAKARDFTYAHSHLDTSGILLGSLSGPGTGAALWKNLRIYSEGQALEIQDFKVELEFGLANTLEKD